ncbi:hypothetical protein HDU98_003012 [Podochytrium sp. JEL0797]|nr:hypothetical protein HDU98_003012 [Podochytrium sp. JEL0797]
MLLTHTPRTRELVAHDQGKSRGEKENEDKENDEEEGIKGVLKSAKKEKSDKKSKKEVQKNKIQKGEDTILSESDDDGKPEKEGFEVVLSSKADKEFDQTKGSVVLDTAAKFTLGRNPPMLKRLYQLKAESKDVVFSEDIWKK